MQPNRVWTLIALAGLAAVTVVRSDRDLDKGDNDRAGSRSARDSTEKDPLVWLLGRFGRSTWRRFGLAPL